MKIVTLKTSRRGRKRAVVINKSESKISKMTMKMKLCKNVF